MFGISFEPSEEKTNKEKEEDLYKKVYDQLESLDNKNKFYYILGFFGFFFVLLSIICVLLFSLSYFSAFAWNNSFAVFFDLPIISWLNVFLGYLFLVVFYRMIKYIF